MSMNFLSPTIILNAVSMAASTTSSGVHVQNMDNVGIQFVWTGTPTGTFGVDVSNDATLNSTSGAITGGTWTPLVLTSPNAPAATGAAGNGFIDLNQTGAAFVRATYTRVSGTGSLTATITGKSV